MGQFRITGLECGILYKVRMKAETHVGRSSSCLETQSLLIRKSKSCVCSCVLLKTLPRNKKKVKRYFKRQICKSKTDICALLSLLWFRGQIHWRRIVFQLSIVTSRGVQW